MSEQRRTDRKRADTLITVTNVITGKRVGHIGNLSDSGLMLISPEPLREDALYQFRFDLPAGDRSRSQTVEVGAHEQWTEEATVPGQFWSGLRFIDISDADQAALQRWLRN